MCFSAAVSFTAGTVLVTVGAISVGKSTTVPQALLSSIPVMFGVQQFAEGVLWLSLVRPEFGVFVVPAKYLFLFFAQVVWPLLVPFIILRLEPEPEKRKVLRALAVTGMFVSFYLAYCLMTYRVDASIDCYHILYSLYFPEVLVEIVAVLYVIAVIGPLFVSGIREIRPLAISIVISLAITAIFYQYYLISLWCFFAAILSVEILYAVFSLNSDDGRKVSFR